MRVSYEFVDPHVNLKSNYNRKNKLSQRYKVNSTSLSNKFIIQRNELKEMKTVKDMVKEKIKNKINLRKRKN